MSFSLSEYTKIDVGWGFASDPTGGAYSASHTPSWFQGGRFAAGGEWRGGEKELGKGEEGKGGKRWEWGREGKRWKSICRVRC